MAIGSRIDTLLALLGMFEVRHNNLPVRETMLEKNALFPYWIESKFKGLFIMILVSATDSSPTVFDPHRETESMFCCLGMFRNAAANDRKSRNAQFVFLAIFFFIGVPSSRACISPPPILACNGVTSFRQSLVTESLRV